MSYKLKTGKVAFLLKTGKDFVKNQMAVASAQHIIDKWYFAGEVFKKSAPRKTEGVAE